ncbi:acyl carrier protein [Micromonospora yangpuensis]|uniref:Act minimal PKS acyl carrier protein n=1 Tax=Micromonospora yangpuensis TaxID=683228 RepID=A0A1C6UFS9_9ACTN|nr:acyl carrier protein [Micromonospora yangpuensis]GGM05540.1 hypothetical protein GCM10012279_24080 [Micromonospora yangpuensis]SCL52824.1 act minimal PKS acyl carrier protein [Micromonospora yangpuensis]
MTPRQFTFADLRRILIEGAGEAEGVQLGQDKVDVTFADLGYESLAMLETGSRIEREFGVTLDDSEVIDAATPGDLIAVVNAHLAVPTAGTSA